MKRKIWSLILACALMLSLFPAGVLAEETQTEPPVQETEVTIPEQTQPETESAEETIPEPTETEPAQTECTEPEPTAPEETLSGEEDIPEEDIPEEEITAAPVKVSFTVTEGGHFVTIEETEVLVAGQELTVPWFALERYGLSSESREVSLTHLLIYATEVLCCGLEEWEAGQGYLMDGEAPDLAQVLQQCWSSEQELICFVDGECWAGQDVQNLAAISLEHDSQVTLACLPENTVAQPGNLTQAKGIITTEAGREVFCVPAAEGYQFGGDTGCWICAGTADGSGTLSRWEWAPGEYLVAVAGYWEGDIYHLPAAVTVQVESTSFSGETEPAVVVEGDVNGDGVLDATDGAALAAYVNGTAELSRQALEQADRNGDGKINMLDVALIYRSLRDGNE